eukprot:1188401-Prorocentrum_minimum.AAC.5
MRVCLSYLNEAGVHGRLLGDEVHTPLTLLLLGKENMKSYGGTVRGGGPRIRAYLHCMRRTASGRIKQCALGERIYLQLKGDAAHGSAVDALHKMLK